MKIFAKKQGKKNNFASKVLQVALVTGFMGAIGLANAETVHGHGYVADPASRAYQGRLQVQQGAMSWNDGFAKYGSAVNEPQSIEGPGSLAGTAIGAFPEGGPADGQIASGGLVGPGLNFSPLDIQREGYWTTTEINPGVNEFTWMLTAGHASRDFQYYMTTPDWNPNTSLTRADFELLETIPYHNVNPGSGTRTHEVNIPADRTGYHVILAVWDIADTNMAFYQVIDVHLTNDEIEERPEPEVDPDLECNHDDLVQKIMWVTRQDNDKDLTQEPSIEVPVDFVDRHGRSEINLLLTGTDHRPLDLTEYEVIFSNEGVLGSTTTTLDWQQRGHIHLPILASGETTVSLRHKETHQVEELLTFIVTTDEEDEEPVAPEVPEEHPTVPAFDPTKVYFGGEIVYFQGNLYRAKWWTQGGNPTNSTAWEIIDAFYADGSTDFRLATAYVGGDLVRFEGNLYRAKWWSQGDLPTNSQAWELVGPVQD